MLSPSISVAQNTLNLPATGVWNSFNQNQVVIECSNPTGQPVALVLDVLQNDGASLSNQNLTIPAFGTSHVVLNPVLGASAAYGTYRLSSPTFASSTPVQCVTAFYRMAASSYHKAVEYAFAVAVENPLTEESFGVINSMNPDPAAPATYNWYSLVNTGSESLSGIVTIFDQTGVLQSDKSFSVSNLQTGERQDYALGHQWGKGLYSYRFVPTSSNPSYHGFVTRYSLAGAGVYRFAIPMPSKVGACDSGLISLSTMNPATAWLVVANPTAFNSSYDVTIRNSVGAVVNQQIVSVPAHGQKHIYVNDHLGTSAVGSGRVVCQDPGSLGRKSVSYAMVYGHPGPGTWDVAWAYVSFPQMTMGTSSIGLLGFHNTFLEAANWFKGS
jgi:hypothetical protein